MGGLRGRRLPPVAAVVLFLAGVGGPVSAQFAETERIIEKPSKEGEGRKLDASGLTNAFAVLVAATRSIDKAEIGGGMVEVNAGRIPLMSLDWQSFLEHEQGLLEFQTFAAIKLRTEADIVVGDLEVPTGNVSPGFAGLYSLWLRLDDNGRWVLIVNNEPDVWGTMHDPAKDLGETRLEHSIVDGGKSRLTIEIEPPEGETPGALKLSWGEHRWQTTVASLGSQVP
ncbi:MAG: DUF2911 domain-containing protein [Acidobacteria bacterium]|nr:DUF2911 domain-containing protein [Acidobacteriota bacterium]